MRTTLPGLIVVLRYMTLTSIRWDEEQKQFDFRSSRIFCFFQLLMSLVFLWNVRIVILDWAGDFGLLHSFTDVYLLMSVRLAESTFLIFQLLWTCSMQQSLASSLRRVLELSNDYGIVEVPSWMVLCWIVTCAIALMRLTYVYVRFGYLSFNFIAKDTVYVIYKVSSYFIKTFYMATGHRIVHIMAASRGQIEEALRRTPGSESQRKIIDRNLSIQNEMLLMWELDLSGVYGLQLCVYMIQDILESTLLTYLMWQMFSEEPTILLYSIPLSCCFFYALIPLRYNDPREEVSIKYKT